MRQGGGKGCARRLSAMAAMTASEESAMRVSMEEGELVCLKGKKLAGNGNAPASIGEREAEAAQSDKAAADQAAALAALALFRVSERRREETQSENDALRSQLERWQAEATAQQALAALSVIKSRNDAFGYAVHLKDTTYHRPPNSNPQCWTRWHCEQTKIAKSDLKKNGRCPCCGKKFADIKSKTGGDQNIVGAHVMFRPEAPHPQNLYVGIVPTCSSCNRSSKAISLECKVATIVDPGMGTWVGNLHKKGKGDAVGPKFVSIKTYAPVLDANGKRTNDLRVVANIQGGEQFQIIYPDESMYLETLLSVMKGGFDRTGHGHLRLTSGNHIVQVFTLNPGIKG